ncbi:MAG: hypothetical protein Q9222_002804 [Ikaeria aurantiellina]
MAAVAYQNQGKMLEVIAAAIADRMLQGNAQAAESFKANRQIFLSCVGPEHLNKLYRAEEGNEDVEMAEYDAHHIDTLAKLTTWVIEEKCRRHAAAINALGRGGVLPRLKEIEYLLLQNLDLVELKEAPVFWPTLARMLDDLLDELRGHEWITTVVVGLRCHLIRQPAARYTIKCFSDHLHSLMRAAVIAQEHENKSTYQDFKTARHTFRSFMHLKQVGENVFEASVRDGDSEILMDWKSGKIYDQESKIRFSLPR